MTKFLIALMLCYCGVAEAIVPADNLAAGIQHILNQSHEPIHVGIVVRDLQSGRVLYSRQANHLYAPASTQKVFTAVAALHYLKKNYQFKTTLLTDGEISNHILKGNLIIRFSGDPTLRVSDLKNLFANLKKQGVQEIRGRVYLDASAYDTVPYPPGWIWDDLSYSYAAPPEAIIINHNEFLLHVTPAVQLKQAPALLAELPERAVRFINDARTTEHYQQNCPLTIYSDLYNTYHISGCINRDWGKQQRTLSMRNPGTYARALVQRILNEYGIVFKNAVTVIYQRDIRATRVLAEHHSAPLDQLVKEMLKKSDNLIAESLLKKMGQRYYQQAGSTQNGLLALQNILKPTMINFKKNNINDGSGLSRYNLLTPMQFSQLLSFAYQESDVRPYLLKALPIGGTDGTLMGRMHWLKKPERLVAKTGSMTGVSALAGYVYTRSGRVLSFVIIVNGFLNKEHVYSILEDRLCEYLSHHVNN